MDKLMVDGFIKFCSYYKNELLLKKNVALFDNYESAKEQIIMALRNSNDALQMEGVIRVIDILEAETDIKEIF